LILNATRQERGGVDEELGVIRGMAIAVILATLDVSECLRMGSEKPFEVRYNRDKATQGSPYVFIPTFHRGNAYQLAHTPQRAMSEAKRSVDILARIPEEREQHCRLAGSRVAHHCDRVADRKASAPRHWRRTGHATPDATAGRSCLFMQ
jgi:hypothetical protein